MNGHDYKCQSTGMITHVLECDWQRNSSFTYLHAAYSGAVNCCILIAVRCRWLKVKTAYLLGIRCSMCLSCDDFEMLFKSLNLFYVSILRK